MCLLQALDTLRGPRKHKVITVEESKQELVALEQIRAEVRYRVRYLTDLIRAERDLVTTEQLDEMPMFDLTGDLERLQDWRAIHRVPSP
jgi:hypothetical protein